MKRTKYYKYKEFKYAYDILEKSLLLWIDCEDNKTKNPTEIAYLVLQDVARVFGENNQVQIIQYLQGMGLNIPIYYSDIDKVLIKSGKMKESDTKTKKQKLRDTYFSFMSMRLIHMAEAYNENWRIADYSKHSKI